MNRRTLLVGLAGISGVACQATKTKRLNVFNWSDYIGRNTLSNFERETGIHVRYGTYEVTEEMLAKVMSGNSGWDIVFPSNSYIRPMQEMGLLAPLDHTRLSNLHNLDAEFQSPPWDDGLRWSVPYMHGSTGIVYSASIEAPRSWADLWSTRYARRMTMLDDPAEVFAACLKRMHASVNATSEAELRAAKEIAVRQKPFLRAYINAEVRDQLAAGDVLAAQSWSITAQQAIEQSTGLRFVYPEEGFPRYCDSAVILRESRRGEVAHLLLNYLLRADVAAEIATEMRTATANGAARMRLTEQDRNNTTLYPDAEILARSEWFRELPAPAQRLRDRLWTEVKSS